MPARSRLPATAAAAIVPSAMRSLAGISATAWPWPLVAVAAPGWPAAAATSNPIEVKVRGDDRGQRARLPGARDQEHDPRRRRGPGRRTPPRSQPPSIRRSTGASPQAVTLVDQEDWAGGHRRGGADGPSAAGADPAHGRRRRPRRDRRTRSSCCGPTGAAARPAAPRRSGSATPPRPTTCGRVRSQAKDRVPARGRDRRVPHADDGRAVART